MTAPDPIAFSPLLQTLQKAVGLLPPSASGLKADVLRVCDRLQHPTLRITVFGPFNYGKSTLLNALLGNKTLPIDLVPTTGAVITVRYGPTLHTRITLTDGTVQADAGTDLLQRYAVLSEQRHMRQDVAAVEVSCPHSFLQTGVELVDLPGTDDREAQDALVQAQLLEADLVIQVLDGRKLMTLAEREYLRDWLLDRGITNVLFVVNFLNLVEPEDRKQVLYRLRFLAASFRAQLPDGISNLYRVDALPALRARLKADLAAATEAGLPLLESALQTIVQTQQPHLSQERLPRLVALSTQVQTALESQVHLLETRTPISSSTDSRRREIQQKAQGLIQQGFQKSVAELRQWLQVAHLSQQFQGSLANALQENTAHLWLEQTLQPAWNEQRGALTDWVVKACAFFECPRPAELWVSLSSPLQLPEPVDAEAVDQEPETAATGKTQPGITPVAIATGLGWALGGPMGAAVLGGASYFINKSDLRGERSSAPTADTVEAVLPLHTCLDWAHTYLSQFSQAALRALTAYEAAAYPVLHQPLAAPSPAASTATREAQLGLLQNTLMDLGAAMQSLKL